MKNYLMFALLIGAASTMAFGQKVECNGCTHDVSVYMGEGGLIAETDADKVVWVTRCDGVTVSGDLTPNAAGKVSMLFNDANGLACHSAGGSMELGPIMAGGWYWITDEMNSAVGNLVDKDVLENATVPLTSAGDGVTVTEGSGAVYLKETATGRVGILPNILPEPPTAPTAVPPKCGGTRQTKCTLGDGGVMISAKGPADVYTGDRPTIKDKGTVRRPASTGGNVLVTFDLRPEPGYLFSGTLPLNASFAATYNDLDTGNLETLSETASDGMLWTVSDSYVATLDLANDTTTYCPTTAGSTKSTAVVTVTATVATSNLGQITPSIVANKTNGTAITTDDFYEEKFTVKVVCFDADLSSSSQGVELIPENLFPTDK